MPDGAEIPLPATVTVSYNDATAEEQSVTWTPGREWVSGPGTYVFRGTTSAGLSTRATVTVTSANLLANPGFEDDDTAMWRTGGTGLTVGAWDDPRTGSRSAHFYAADRFAFTLEQSVGPVPAGTYRATGALQGGGQLSDTVRLAVSSGTQEASVPFVLGGWRNWSTPTTDTSRSPTARRSPCRSPASSRRDPGEPSMTCSWSACSTRRRTSRS
ncbi:Ig-like domain-containing protein [Microbacterium sp. SORGH_AS_0862]|uniref:Ig-like domain-containing protein n=1 Tax=Microbacterium sp. SORGH_AS_0862 TaxID=3041789 RepID=UPI0027D7EC71|nr:Ig-like domain-containing protein [Microbacterium sp. SORGH_AS_0862]